CAAARCSSARSTTPSAVSAAMKQEPTTSFLSGMVCIYQCSRGPRAAGAFLLLRQELLYPLSLEVLTRVDVALRIDRDAADGVEGPGIAPAVAEAADDFERGTAEDEDLLIVAVCDVQELLLRIAR